jgi:hypothetical protein
LSLQAVLQNPVMPMMHWIECTSFDLQPTSAALRSQASSDYSRMEAYQSRDIP